MPEQESESGIIGCQTLIVLALVAAITCLYAARHYVKYVKKADEGRQNPTTLVYVLGEDVQSISIRNFVGELTWMMETSVSQNAAMFNEDVDAPITIFADGEDIEIKVPKGAKMFILKGRPREGQIFSIKFNKAESPVPSHLLVQVALFLY